MVITTYVELNFVALMILVVTFANMNHKIYRYSYEQKLFLALLCVNALQLVLDTVSFILNGAREPAAGQANLLINVFYYIVTPVSCILWSMYADFQVYRDEKRIIRLSIPLTIPAAVNAVLAVLSYFKGYAFFIDDNNVYHRGKLFFVVVLICLLYLIYTQIFISVRYKQLVKKYFFPLFSFALLPLLGGILQAIFYGVSLVWVCMSISVLIVSNYILHDELYTDALTGLSNRRLLNCLPDRFNSGGERIILAGIMIDVDAFKSINDEWGHSAGDQALVAIGEILRKSFRKNDLICRYGGDEFVVIFEAEQQSELYEAVGRIKANVERSRDKKDLPYSISLSMGYDLWDCGSETSFEQFINHIDMLMYEDKKKQNV